MPLRTARPDSPRGHRAPAAPAAPARPATMQAPVEPLGRALDDEPLDLPPAWVPPHRTAVPVLASIVPVLGAVALWCATGSILSLWLAFLGPLIAAATILDAARGARRDRARSERTAAVARQRVSAAVDERHRAERERLWARHPDAVSFATRSDEVWRAVPGRAEMLVVGAGDRASTVRVTGGDGDDASTALRARAAVLDNAPITIPITAGLAVAGPAVLVQAVVRGLVVQLCSALSPGRLRIVGSIPEAHAWAEVLPHRRATTGTTLAIVGPDDVVPPDAEIVLAHTRLPAPARCAAVLTVRSPFRAALDYAGDVVPVSVEAFGEPQCAHIAEGLAARAAGEDRDEADPVMLAPLLARSPHRREGSLSAVVGAHAGRPVVVDLVDDGPHAVVAGVTGSGKSELLITWILSLCAAYSTGEVNFLLADFKGGTAFDALAGIPHVTGVITDLDGAGARRAIESLRAEVRWREAELARAGARDVLDERARLPRLVVVVDEFAALLSVHPELQAVFTDIAARGRALGMHLILGTQRVAGVIRDALLTNCPLRLSLRVIDEADSRAVVGTPDAARLPGGSHGRGFALVRRAADAAPQPIRVALSTSADARAATDRDAGPRPRRPWLPDLPGRVELGELRREVRPHEIVLGLVDEPDRQRQRAEVLAPDDRGLIVTGAAGSGKTALLRSIAAQADGREVWIPRTPEAAWDAVATLADHLPHGSVVLIDDLDALAGLLPQEYAHALMERIENIARAAGGGGSLVAASVQRPTSAVGRITELLPRRALLSMRTRAEYLGAGGDAAHFEPDAPPGRGRLDGRAIQFAWCEPLDAVREAKAEDEWMPFGAVTGFVARRSATARSILARWEDHGVTVTRIDELPRDADIDALAARAPRVVVVGEPDEWQRQWAILSRIRGEHDLVIDAACAPEYRVVAGDRELPPYCEPGRWRAWLRREDGPAVRVVLGSGADRQDLPRRVT